MKYWFPVFTVISSLGLAAPLFHDTRSVHDIREEVEDLMTSNERTEAMKTIATRLKDEKRETVRADLRKLQDEVSEIFLTEKGLQSFELGRSLILTDTAGAMTRFREAEQIEALNLTVRAGIARADMRVGDCAQALEETKKSFEFNENYKPLLLIHLQALICQQGLKEAKVFLEQRAVDLQLYAPAMLQLSRGQIAYFSKDYEAARDQFEKAKESAPGFPEVYYWLGQAEDQLKQDDLPEYRKYVALCQEPSRDRRRQFDLEPRTCLEIKAVEKMIEARIAKAKG